MLVRTAILIILISGDWVPHSVYQAESAEPSFNVEKCESTILK
jgi:hypothetical protein